MNRPYDKRLNEINRPDFCVTVLNSTPPSPVCFLNVFENSYILEYPKDSAMLSTVKKSGFAAPPAAEVRSKFAFRQPAAF